MNRTYAYLLADRHVEASHPHEDSVRPFVTISREAGSGGAHFARMLARALNTETDDDATWTVHEGNILAGMLKSNHLPARFARFLPEDRVPEVNALAGELTGLHPNLWLLVEKINETMRQLARRGHVILVGRGANFATAGLPHGIHVRLVAPPAHRARYLERLYNISFADAVRANAKCEAARRRYVQSHFNADVRDPCAYNFVLNTERMPLPQAVQFIAGHVRAAIVRPEPELAVVRANRRSRAIAVAVG
jgi:cytidylate kinase